MSKTDAYYAFLEGSARKRKPELVPVGYDPNRRSYTLRGGLETQVGRSEIVTVLNPRFANDQKMAESHRPSNKFTGYHVVRIPNTQECKIYYLELL